MPSETERLQELLDKKDEELEALQEKVDTHDNEETRERLREEWKWTHHTFLKQDDVVLPVPRLEMRWVTQDDRGYNRICWYYLVYKHLLDDIVKVPLGSTRVNGGSSEPFYDGKHAANPEPKIDVPFRDGAHIANEARQLRLPAFVIWEDKVQEILPEEERGFTLGPVSKLEYTKED
jgi:hypothetical protein